MDISSIFQELNDLGKKSSSLPVYDNHVYDMKI